MTVNFIKVNTSCFYILRLFSYTFIWIFTSKRFINHSATFLFSLNSVRIFKNIACCFEKVHTHENHIQICIKELSIIPKKYKVCDCSIHFSRESCDSAKVGGRVIYPFPISLEIHVIRSLIRVYSVSRIGDI